MINPREADPENKNKYKKQKLFEMEMQDYGYMNITTEKQLLKLKEIN